MVCFRHNGYAGCTRSVAGCLFTGVLPVVCSYPEEERSLANATTAQSISSELVQTWKAWRGATDFSTMAVVLIVLLVAVEIGIL